MEFRTPCHGLPFCASRSVLVLCYSKCLIAFRSLRIFGFCFRCCCAQTSNSKNVIKLAAGTASPRRQHYQPTGPFPCVETSHNSGDRVGSQLLDEFLESAIAPLPLALQTSEFWNDRSLLVSGLACTYAEVTQADALQHQALCMQPMMGMPQNCSPPGTLLAFLVCKALLAGLFGLFNLFYPI